ncbi:MAG TPA: PDZ domain-containing protein, partial [Vicinamibacterales bacterium]|nr:PDZ domain-containing protein [Vicinamibacterales bacterium]
GTIDVRLQPLDPALAAATGARTGAVVTHVAPDGPAAGALVPGDVIVAVAGRPVDSPVPALLEIARYAPGSPVPLDVRRNRERMQITVRPRAITAPVPAEASTQLGAALRPEAGGSRVQAVTPGSAAAGAGLERGDLITWIGTAERPTPQHVAAAWQSLPAGRWLMAGIVRSDAPLVVALRKPEMAAPSEQAGGRPRTAVQGK